MYTVYCTGLRGWSRLALAEDTFWFSLSFWGYWIDVQANRGCRFCLVFNNCLMVWATTNPNVYPGAASLLFLPRKENRRAFFNSARKISTENWINFVQMRQEKHHIFWFGRQISFCARFQWPMTGSFEVEVSIICKRTIFPRCENLL